MWNNYFPSDYKIPCAGKLKLREKEGNTQLVALENRENLPEGLIESYNLRWKKTYNWILKYVEEHTLKECDTEIKELRKNLYKNLIKKYKPLKYYVKDTTAKASDPKLAMYHIFQNASTRSGSYSSLMNYVEEIKDKKSIKCITFNQKESKLTQKSHK